MKYAIQERDFGTIHSGISTELTAIVLLWR